MMRSRFAPGVTVDHTADLASQVRGIAPNGVDVVAHLAGDIGVVDLVRAGGRFVSTMVMSPDQVPTQSAVVVPVYANPTPEVLEKCAARPAGAELASWSAGSPVGACGDLFGVTTS